MKILIVITRGEGEPSSHTSYVVELGSIVQVRQAEAQLKERDGRNGIYYTVTCFFEEET